MIKRFIAALLAFLALSVFAAASVDVNKASQAELDAVKGIGPAIAGKIIAERNKGPFKDWDDLIKRVNGFGPKSSVKFSENGLTVNGASYQTAVPKAAPAAPAPVAKPATTAAPAPAPAPAPASSAKKDKKDKAAKAASAAK